MLYAYNLTFVHLGFVFGLRQGSTLGPGLFCVFVDDLARTVSCLLSMLKYFRDQTSSAGCHIAVREAKTEEKVVFAMTIFFAVAS